MCLNITCTKFCRKCNFWKLLVSFTFLIYLEWYYFSIESDCQSQCNVALFATSSQTNTSWIFWCHCSTTKRNILWWCLVTIKHKGLWNVIFLCNFNNSKMTLEPCFFSCSSRDFHFSGCCNSPPKFKSLEDTMFLIRPPFLKSVIKNYRTFSSITGPTINGLSLAKLVMY